MCLRAVPPGVTGNERDRELGEAFRRAVAAYNAYRSPRATATVDDRRPREWRVRFEGSFHRSCCRDDYFDDLRYELDEQGVPAEAVDVGPIERLDRETFVVTFAVDPRALATSAE